MTFSRFQERFFQIGLVALLFISGFVWVSAEETTSEETAGSEEDYACAKALIEGSELVLEEYFTFLDEYFQVDTPSSDQLTYAMYFYRYVEDTLYNLYEANATISGSGALAFKNQELSICRDKRDDYLLLARTALYKQVMGSATYKTTFKFVDGLKIMNDQLSDMSAMFQQTFPGQFKQMDSGLECYASQCVSQ